MFRHSWKALALLILTLCTVVQAQAGRDQQYKRQVIHMRRGLTCSAPIPPKDSVEQLQKSLDLAATAYASALEKGQMEAAASIQQQISSMTTTKSQLTSEQMAAVEITHQICLLAVNEILSTRRGGKKRDKPKFDIQTYAADLLLRVFPKDSVQVFDEEGNLLSSVDSDALARTDSSAQ